MNVLKTNNRFASLLDDTHTRQIRAPINKKKYKHDESNISNKIKNDHPSINMNDFPSLISTRTTHNTSTVTPNYIKKLKHQVDIEEEKGDVIPYGWVVITSNKYNNPHNIIPTLPPDCMDSFVKLYNKRKEDYIALWGEETYENVFLFPNYDYNYFDYDEEDDDDDDDEVSEEYYAEYYDGYYN